VFTKLVEARRKISEGQRKRYVFQITAHLSWALSEVTYRNEEHHEYVEVAGNIDSSASGDSAHLSPYQNVCWEII
jgi:uncharacterized protein RhaS with RHS repeats